MNIMEKGAIIKYNPQKAPRTGDWAFMVPEVKKEKCVGCATCVQFCPEAAISMEHITRNPVKPDGHGASTEQKKKATVDYDFCKGCGVCATVCPNKAIIMKKK
ncbi:MAG: 4Fe-4S binding protein [Candidatus Moranbacteria bacterium]|nr:4Fe-4S binding protein [Candidatus Moranbacteria bacterium]